MKKYALIKNDTAIKFATFGTPSQLAPNKGQWVEVNDEGKPTYNPETQICTSAGRLYYGKWKIEYTIRGKTPFELWDYPEFTKLIIAPISLIMTDEGVKMKGWWELNGLKWKVKEDMIYLYCNEILEEHQGIVDAFAGLLTIEDIPTE